jgi:hypothetical protein
MSGKIRWRAHTTSSPWGRGVLPEGHCTPTSSSLPLRTYMLPATIGRRVQVIPMSVSPRPTQLPPDHWLRAARFSVGEEKWAKGFGCREIPRLDNHTCSCRILCQVLRRGPIRFWVLQLLFDTLRRGDSKRKKLSVCLLLSGVGNPLQPFRWIEVEALETESLRP